MKYKVKIRRKMVDVLNQNGATLAWTSHTDSTSTRNGLWYITPALSAQDLISLSTFLSTLNVKELTKDKENPPPPVPSSPLT